MQDLEKQGGVAPLLYFFGFFPFPPFCLGAGFSSGSSGSSVSMSDTITVINRGDIDFSKLNKGLKERGYEISNGYGDIKESTFRVGHMGDLTPAEVRGLLKNMDEVLEAM